MDYRLERRIAGRGAGDWQFKDELRGVACDRRGNWFLVGDREVKVLSRDGAPIGRWPTRRPGWSVTVDDLGNVWVGEPGQIEIFSASGELEDSWRDAELFRLVTALAVTPNEVLVADAGSRWIHRFGRDRQLLNHIGDQHRKGGFHIPSGVLDFALDGDDSLVVANPGMHRVERYSLDGTYRGHFGRFGQRDPAAFPGCCNPTHLAVGPAGEIVVTEKAGPRVKSYDRDGVLLAVIADTTQFDPACKNMDLAVDADGTVGVADTVALSVALFERQATPETVTAKGALA